MFKGKYESDASEGDEVVADIVPSRNGDDAVGETSFHNGVEEFQDELKGDTEHGSEGSEEEPETYPADCYSFMSVHGPTSPFFYFGFFVWVFQVVFLVVMVINVIHPRLSTNENDDNPDAEDGNFWAYIIPANAGNLSKLTQYLALISYCVFADESLKDIATAVETFPNFKKARPGDNVPMIVTSCLLRLIQGVGATFVVWLLVNNTTNIIDIILNFTAVNFISAFDDVAFELAQMGKYGPRIKAEADRIEELPAPRCMIRKNQHVRYCWTVVPVAILLITTMTIVTVRQQSSDYWLTQKLRVQFKDDPLRGVYNGCYEEVARIDKRVVFESDANNEEQARFGYCQSNRKWYLYKGNASTPCDIEEEDKVAYSSRTYFFDFSSVAEETWYSRTGTPLELYFFDDNKNNLTDDECASFLGDGKCDDVFNIFDHNYDEGDCCAATCEGLTCGHGALAEAFNNNVSSGNGYPNCINKSMKNITIKLENVYVPPDLGLGDTPSPFDGIAPRDPLMILDCDGTNVLMVNIKGDMKFQTETVKVADGADCQMSVKNSTGGPLDIQYVNYTVYHGDEDSLETNPIVIFSADSSIDGKHSFRRIPECYFDKLSDYVDVSTIYTGDGPSNKAIEWLMNDSDGYSNCQYDSFIERYALATINFAAPRIDKSEDGDSTELWITEELHCVWKNVACIDESVVELDLGSASGIFLSGTIATEIGLLKNLDWLELGVNDIYGSIPTEIGEWKNLTYFGVDFANLSGKIPTELAKLTNFEWLILNDNQLTGSIPTEIGQMTSMKAFVISNNFISGPIPDEIEQVSLLQYFFTANNTITGTLPTALGLLTDLIYVNSFSNELSGNIPSEIAKITALQYIQLADNSLTGSIPIELFNRSYIDFDFYGNPLEDLIPVEGQEICDAEEGEIYCNCASDCTFRPYHCGCDAGKSCCDTFLAQYTQCKPCPTEGLKNPDLYVEAYLSTCQGIAGYVENSLIEFGTPETCYGGKLFLDAIGCFCKSPDDAVSMPEAESLITDSVDV